MIENNANHRRLGLGIAHVLGGGAIAGGISLLGQVGLARMLGAECVGQFAAVAVVVETCMLPVSFGFNQSVIRDASPSAFRGALALVILQSLAFLVLVALAVTVAGSPLLPQGPQGAMLAFAYCASRVIGFFATLLYAPLERELDYRQISQARTAAALGGTAVGLVSAFYWRSPWALMGRELASAVLVLWLTMHRPARLRPDFGRQAMVPVWRFSAPLLGLNVLEKGAIRLDYLIAAVVLNPALLGVYHQVRGLLEGLANIVISPLQTVFYSYYCRRAEGGTAALHVSRTLKAIALALGAGGALVGAFLGRPVLSLALGEEWVVGAVLLPGLAAYCVAIAWFENIKALSLAAGIHRRMLWPRLAQVVVLALFSFPAWNLIGLGGLGASAALGAATLAAWATVRYEQPGRVGEVRNPRQQGEWKDSGKC